MEGTTIAQPYVTLNNGLKMPQIGLGTFGADEGANLEEVVKSAILNHGYRHIDTAFVYFNEEIIGKALKACFEAGIKREDLFITTKLWRDQYADIEGALNGCLERLQLDYVDLYLVHWVIPEVNWETKEIKPFPMHKVWAGMEALVKKGLTKSIGVSNCTVPQLIDLLAYAEIKPVTNQIELHPYLVQEDLVKLHQMFDITVTAYAPLGA